MTENEMLLLQREQYLGPGRMSSISQYSTGPIVRGNRQAASVTREMSLQPTLRPSQQKNLDLILKTVVSNLFIFKLWC